VGAVTLTHSLPDPQPDTVSTFFFDYKQGPVSNSSLHSNHSNHSEVRSIMISSACRSDGNTSARTLSCGLPSTSIATVARYADSNCATPPAEIFSVPDGFFSRGISVACTAPRRLAPLNDTLCNAGVGCHSAGDALAQCKRFHESTAAAASSIDRNHYIDYLYKCQCSSTSFSGSYCVLSIQQQLAVLTRNATYTESLRTHFILQDPRDPINAGRVQCPDGSMHLSSHPCQSSKE